METALVRIETKTIGEETRQTVDARELHAFLKVGRKFGGWIRGRIDQYGFEENRDYVILRPQTGYGYIGAEVNYALAIDMAKELAMVERNEQGRLARRYFIEVENKFRKATESAPLKLIPAAGDAFASLLSVAEKFGFEGNQKILSASKAVRLVTGIDFPELLGATHLIAEKQVRHFTPTELGERLGVSAIKFNQLLCLAGFQEKHSKDWVPTEAGKRFAVLLDTGKKHSNGTPVQQLKWTEDVLDFVQKQSA